MDASSWPSRWKGNGSSSSSSTEVVIAGGEDRRGSILDSAGLYEPSARTFSYVSTTMSDGRAFQTATLLEDGRGLVAGGVNTGGSVIDSAALYASTSGKFSATAAMSNPRQPFASTLLDHGEVLRSGGLANGKSTSRLYTAELYEPSSTTFVAADNTVAARSAHPATLLKNGQVLIAGGISDAGISFTGAELYDPTTGKFTSAGTMTEGHVFHTATLLGSGEVVIAGGEAQVGNPGNTAVLYNRSSGAFIATTGTNEGESRVSNCDPSYVSRR